VDEHLLRCIGILHDIDAGRSEDTKFATETHAHHAAAEPATALRCSLLHDIAKGRQEDHSIAAAASRVGSVRGSLLSR